MKVKMYFENEDDLHKCYLKWQKRLGLQDWCIGVGLVDPEDMEEGRAGERAMSSGSINAEQSRS